MNLIMKFTLNTKFTLNPPLEHIALVNVVITLWNRDDIRALIKEFPFPVRGKKKNELWQEIENRVIKKVSHLPLPELLKDKILYLIKPIGKQISKWIAYHCGTYINIHLPNELCWTPQGTVDRKKTAEMLIKDGSINITERYKLACIYCLEDDVSELWSKIPENCKKDFYNAKDISLVKQHELVIIWTYQIKGETDKIEIKYQSQQPFLLDQHACQQAAIDGNRAAVEYFFQKLPPIEKILRTLLRIIELAVTTCRKYDRSRTLDEYTDVLCFILSQMSVKHQLIALVTYPYEILRCFLDWPWHCYLRNVADLIERAFVQWDVKMNNDLAEKCHDYIFKTIIHRIMKGYKDINYSELFRDLWLQNSKAHKNFIRSFSIDELLYNLLVIKDRENIKLIFQDLTFFEKNKLMYSDMGKYIWKNTIYANEWDLFYFFIQESFSSTDEIIKFKEEFKKCLSWLCLKTEYLVKSDKWGKFFCLLDDIICGNDKINFTKEVLN